MLKGNRFCEPGIHEPDQHDPNLWFQHHSYNQDDEKEDSAIKTMNSVVTQRAGDRQFDPERTLWTDQTNAMWSKVGLEVVEKASALHVQRYSAVDISDKHDLWSDTIVWRARVFHPTSAFQQKIYEATMMQYLEGHVYLTERACITISWIEP